MKDPKERGQGHVGTSPPAPGEVVMESLSEYLPEDKGEEQSQIDLLMAVMHKRLVTFHSGGGTGTPHGIQPQLQIPAERKIELQKAFILSLHYREREYRESAITSPYDKTFQWIFGDGPKRETARFPLWLRSDENLFWVTGKAGSGKSTLMKYVSDFRSRGEGAALCKSHLLEWAGASKLVTASFYFWASGSAVQGSQKAMFNSLLFQLLQESPDIIPQIAPAIWESACLFKTNFRGNWTESVLGELLYSAVKELSVRKVNTCLFIDGLDEFAGNKSGLISTIRKVSEIANIKLCVSSRPWVEFEDSFGRGPSLRVQDLTYPDIKHFVVSHFEQNEGFRRLKEREPGFSNKLMHQITDKSSGVFLWVRLAVESLLAGLSNDDRIQDLERRLQSLPPDLEQLFERILRDLDPFYFKHACQYFQLVLESNGSVDGLLLSFADEEDIDFAVRLPIRPLSKSRYLARVATLRRRLNSRCKGLLEISGRRGRVDFLHRTVKDFLVRPDVMSKINQELAGIDIHLQLCSASLSMLKTRETFPGFENRWKPIYRREYDDSRENVEWLESCLEAASKVTLDKESMIRIMRSLHRFTKEHPEIVRPGVYFWLDMTSWRLRFSEGSRHESFTGDPFLALVTRFGILDYLQVSLEPGAYSGLRYKITEPQHGSLVAITRKILSSSRPKSDEGYYPLLVEACLCPSPNPAVFKYLLDRGASYNRKMNTRYIVLVGKSQSHRFSLSGAPLLVIVVCAALVATISGSSSERRLTLWKGWAEVLRVFIKDGARLDESLVTKVTSKLNEMGRDRQRDLKNVDVGALLSTVSTRDYVTIDWWRLRYQMSSKSSDKDEDSDEDDSVMD